jgi:3-oxoacyl-[acyl-carrier protein] reductase
VTDRYQQFLHSPVGEKLSEVFPLPAPPELRRYRRGQPLAHGPALVGGTSGGQLRAQLREVLAAADVDVRDELGDDERPAVLVFDATGIARSDDLVELHAFLRPVLRRLLASGRVIVLGRPPESLDDPRARTAQRALEGAVRSLGKELRDGATAQLVHVEAGAEGDLAATLRFLVSARSAYVSGQVVRVGRAPDDAASTVDWDRPLDGQVALVTGASRGIGAAIAEVLARDGAHVVCLDIPTQGDALARVANAVGGTTLQLDVTTEDAPQRLVDHLVDRHGGVDIVVHNAGITRDKTLANMDGAWWESVISVNLTAPERLDEALLERGLNEGGRVVCVSSMAGIAGGKGQTNYAASKAGLIGHVEALADDLAGRGGSINAVAPGFIETEMTGAMPLVPREFGRRMNSLSQGGLPADVAEAIAWFASPATRGGDDKVLPVSGPHLV